jgi:predicted acyl esterase
MEPLPQPSSNAPKEVETRPLGCAAVRQPIRFRRKIMEQAQSRKQTQSVVADGMRIDWDVPIPMEDGVILRADVFRPLDDGHHPVIMNLGPYAKGLAFQDDFYKGSWNRMISAYPDIAEGSSNKYQNWEVVDPEKWVPDGYVCVRVDSRGAGHSQGQMEVWSPRERRDYYN